MPEFDPEFFPAKMKNKWLTKGSQLVQVTVGTDVILEGLVKALTAVPELNTCEHGPDCDDEGHEPKYIMHLHLLMDGEYDPNNQG